MSTDWLPIKQIKYEDFKSNLPPEAEVQDAKGRYIYPSFCFKWMGTFTWVMQTPAGGTMIEQFGPNQKSEVVKAIGDHYKNKFISYIGEPWDHGDPLFEDLYKGEGF